jgi:hypothetical protein
MSQLELDADHVRRADHRGQAIVNPAANDRARKAALRVEVGSDR